MMQAVNLEQGPKKGALQIDRYDVMRELWENHKWIQAQLKKQHLSKTLNQRLYALSVDTSCLKGLLHAFKDTEIEIRLAELEKKTKDGVVIPKHE